MHSKRLEIAQLLPLSLFAAQRIVREASHNFPSIPLDADHEAWYIASLLEV
jgi:hypothetical protein